VGVGRLHSWIVVSESEVDFQFGIARNEPVDELQQLAQT